MARNNASFLARVQRNWNDLFIVRRRPKILGVPKEWDPPTDEAEFQKMLQYDDFLSTADMSPEEAAKHPVIVQDMNDLRQYLLPTFYEMSQKSKHYQNLYYLYQWVFIIGAFLTTLFGTLATYNVESAGASAAVSETSGSGSVVEDAAASGIGSGNDNTLSRAYSIVTALVGFATAFFTALSNRKEPQKRWGNTRRLAEEMRMHYFKFLSHQQPYEGGDRLAKLRENIVKIKEQEYV
jgi:hypothetical protein